MPGFPSHLIIPVVGIVCGTALTLALLFPFVRAGARRMEHNDERVDSKDITLRLARIEAAVESIAVEVERVAEYQRFLSKTQTARPLEAGSPPDRQG